MARKLPEGYATGTRFTLIINQMIMRNLKLLLSALVLTTTLQAQSTLKALQLKDSAVVRVLNEYVDQNEFFKRSDVNAFLLLKVEDNKAERLIYVGANTLVSYFKSNVPDCYAFLNERLVFIYDSRASSGSMITFENFYKEFSNSIRKDVSIDGQILRDFKPSYLISPSTWRVKLSDEKSPKIQQVFFFPSRPFSLEYTYDEDGHLMYNDGIYASGETPPVPPVGFSLATYLKNTAFINQTLNMGTTITFVIDEDGKALDVKVEGITDEALSERIVRAIMSMPRWSPGKVDGTIVKMRDSFGLKEF